METKEFANKVVTQFCDELTDLLFLYIENDKELMLEYLRLVSDHSLDTVNQDLGLQFKEKFFVSNKDRNDNPKSKLIMSYTKHTVPNK